MLLSIKEMEARKLPFAEVWQPGDIDFTDSGTRQIGPLIAEGVAELLPIHGETLRGGGVHHAKPGEDVRVKGRVQATLETECDRCLGRAAFHIDAPFDLFYRPLASVSEDEGEEVAIAEGEAEMGFYELPGLELEDIIREQLLLQLPMQRVCSADCKGICPICGANRNEIACTCQAHPGDDRWMALKDLHI